MNEMMSWYKEGLFINAPEFLKCRTCLCYYIGCCGVPLTKPYRSQLFFVGFWVSFISWVFIAAAVCSISKHASIVKTLPFFEGTISVTNTTSSNVSELKYYAGLNILVVDSCSTWAGSEPCPPHSQSWESVECDQYFDNCDECSDASLSSVVTVLIALITQFPTMICDLQRSTVRGDFPMMKFIGVVTGLIGIGSTVQAMVSFGSACFHDLTPNSDAVSIDRTEGAALLCLIIGTGLKVFDVLLHLLVPAPLPEEVVAAAGEVQMKALKTEEEGEEEEEDDDQKEVKVSKHADLVYDKECLGSKAWQPVSVLVSDDFVSSTTAITDTTDTTAVSAAGVEEDNRVHSQVATTTGHELSSV